MNNDPYLGGYGNNVTWKEAHSSCSRKGAEEQLSELRVMGLGRGAVVLIKDILFQCADFRMGDCFCSTLE